MELLDLKDVKYHPIQEKLVSILRTRTMNTTADSYFRGISAFFMTLAASSMQAKIVTPHRGTIPVNTFICALGESGMGKGYSLGILEQEIMRGFSRVFTRQTFNDIAAANMRDEARDTAVCNSTDEDVELATLTSEFVSCGNIPYTFDSGTGPAFKQIRNKMQIAKCGSLNLICDEIGSNLRDNEELFKVNLEAYDMGRLRQKITKNSNENTRSIDRDTPVPSNMLVFGTPVALFNGGAEEKIFLDYLAAGYGRRFIFVWGHKSEPGTCDAEELFERLTSQNTTVDVNQLALHFEQLADPIHYAREIPMSRAVSLINLQYQINCEARADEFSAFDTIRKAEMEHRYFKTAKLAGAYAFVDNTPEITEEQMYAAIKFVEDSGEDFNRMMTQDKNYVRLAKYISQVPNEVTYADLAQDLPFFTGSKAVKEEMVSLARAWGSKNYIVIKKFFEDGFDILKGETLKQTDLNKIKFSISQYLAKEYFTGDEHDLTKWEDFGAVVTRPDLHWCNHAFADNHRLEVNAQGSFNLVVIDVDGGCQLEQAKEYLKEYTALYYTTKRSTPEVNRFRIVLPIAYELKMTAPEYTEFMQNVFEWLPFETDSETGQRSKKWCTHAGHHEYNDGVLLEPTQFIPRTATNDNRIREAQSLGDMNRVEAWFARSIQEGNRNKTIARFAFMLLDTGLEPDEVERAVLSFNEKLRNPLSTDELRATVLKSMWSKAVESGKV